MNSLITLRRAVPVLLLAVLAVPATAAEPYQTLLDQKAEMVVAVKYVLTLSFGGGREREQTVQSIGVVVDKVGVVMMPNPSIGGPMGGFGGRGIDIKAVPSDFRVIFAGDTKEYPGILGASDSKVGLAFVRIKDLEGKEIHPLAAENAATPEIGDVLYGVSRQPQGFDYAPYVADCRVSGKIQKPREMYHINGDFLNVGHPLFTKDGVVAGIIVNQEGVGGGAGTFLLPWKTASGIVQRATKASETALEEAKKKEAEAAAEAEKPAEKPADAPAEPKPSEPAQPDPKTPDPKAPEPPADGPK